MGCSTVGFGRDGYRHILFEWVFEAQARRVLMSQTLTTFCSVRHAKQCNIPWHYRRLNMILLAISLFISFNKLIESCFFYKRTLLGSRHALFVCRTTIAKTVGALGCEKQPAPVGGFQRTCCCILSQTYMGQAVELCSMVISPLGSPSARQGTCRHR